jgi:TolB-like protein/tetratricopeptide (TPR) repeat protein
MEGESPTQASTPAGAVFLSYASEDAEAARRICQALRVAGIEVWLDQSELRGGEAWDRQIHERIHDCRLFIALISTHTEARDEGYFRREWKLAVDRTHDMLEKKAFLLPVAIDATPERGAAVPDKFHEVQWTRLPGGEAPPEFVARIKRLLSPEPAGTAKLLADAASGSSPTPLTTRRPSPLRRALPIAVAVLVLTTLAYVLTNKPWISKPAAPLATSKPTSSQGAPPGAFTPPPHSIAVLPFVNMSGDKEQEYFSDGLTEEILNSLTRISELQVSARTSSFAFKGKDTDVATIARKLNVASVLEGSMRRSRRTIRVTAQLNDAVTGYHLWSETYDRDLGDVLKLQTDIANAVTGALKVTLLGDPTSKIEAGGTRNAAAFDAYLRGINVYRGGLDKKGLDDAIAAYSEAIRLDPNYASAYSDRSIAFFDLARNWATGNAVGNYRERSKADARKAVALAPNLADGHLALAAFLEWSLEFGEASQEYQRALALAAGNARLLSYYGNFAVLMGQIDAGVTAARRAVALDPLNYRRHLALGIAEMYARHYPDALSALKQASVLAPNNPGVNSWLGFTYYASGDPHSASAACENADQSNKPLCLAMAYNKLGRHSDAKAILARFQADRGNTGALFYAMIYAQWGDVGHALDWLEVAMHQRDPYLEKLKASASFDPLRMEPRFQAVMRELKFPE